MTPENSQELVSLYPELFPSKHFCFECGDGWFDLIKECIQKIKADCLEKEMDTIVAQVKEKYGTLRIYLNLTTDEQQKIIDEAEEKSEKTCEVCGKPGFNKKIRSYWWAVRCQDCGFND